MKWCTVTLIKKNLTINKLSVKKMLSSKSHLISCSFISKKGFHLILVFFKKSYNKQNFQIK